MNELSEAADAAESLVGKHSSSGILSPEVQLTAVVGLAISLYAGAGFECSGNWMVILACLWTTAACALGVDNVRAMYRDFSVPAFGAIPVTDKTFFDLGVANKFANSCQVREKGLKIVQYILKTIGYCGLFSKGVAKAAKDLSKTTSIARRFFKFCRCASAGLDPPTSGTRPIPATLLGPCPASCLALAHPSVDRNRAPQGSSTLRTLPRRAMRSRR